MRDTWNCIELGSNAFEECVDFNVTREKNNRVDVRACGMCLKEIGAERLQKNQTGAGVTLLVASHKLAVLVFIYIIHPL